MKVALDEHIPYNVAEALKALSGERDALKVTFCAARDYAIPNAESDVPWLEKFAKSGGKVVISGDAKMRGKLHEQNALREAGFIVLFLSRKWNRMRLHDKCAMLIRWWPCILEKIASARPGQFFEIPNSWTATEMREVTPPKRIRRKKKARKGSVSA